MNYWQISAGEGRRNYANLFLEYGVILMGTGDPGSYLKYPEKYRGKKDWRRKIVTLADKVKLGDAVILKRGHGEKGRIVAAGRVIGDYEWLESFGDVDGWDLRHGRRVEWFSPRSPEQVKGLARGTISRVQKSGPKEIADDLLIRKCARVEAIEIPPAAASLNDDDLMDRLASDGPHGPDTVALKATIQSVKELAGWYIPRMSRISEHEVRTFLIAPILLALGWSEQRIKIEWNHTDVSLFSEPFRRGVKPEDPRVILESKRMGTGLDHAERQVRRYARDFPRCNMLVTTTGVRYHLYTKKPKPSETWDASKMKESHLSAALNLFNLKDRHPYLPGVGGAPDLFKNLMPG